MPPSDKTLVFLSNTCIIPVLSKHFRSPASTHTFHYLLLTPRENQHRLAARENREGLLDLADTHSPVHLSGSYSWRRGEPSPLGNHTNDGSYFWLSVLRLAPNLRASECREQRACLRNFLLEKKLQWFG